MSRPFKRFLLAGMAVLALTPFAIAGGDDINQEAIVASVGRCKIVKEERSFQGQDVYVLKTKLPPEKGHRPASNEYTMTSMHPFSDQATDDEHERFLAFVKTEARLGGLCN